MVDDFDTFYRNEVEHKPYLKLSTKEVAQLVYDRMIDEITSGERYAEILQEEIDQLEERITALESVGHD